MRKPHRTIARFYTWLIVDVRVPRWSWPLFDVTLGRLLYELYRRGY